MKRRHGFTLVELLVSMALIIFLMAIISQAFVAALGSFRNLKAQGDMAEKLRAVTQILEYDLAAEHFGGGRRLSDTSFWNNGPPSQGFFRIWQGSAGTPESVLGDPSGINSYLSTNHYLAFTVKLRGNDMGDFMSASAAGSGLGGNLQMSSVLSFGPPESRYQGTSGSVTSGFAYNYQWAEVAWFMQPQINPVTLLSDTTAADPTSGSLPVPLFTLYRRQRLLVPDNNLVALDLVSKGLPPAIPITQYPNYLEMSCSPDSRAANTTLYFNNPSDITVPWRRFGMFAPLTPANLSYTAGLPYCTIAYPPSQWPLLPTQLNPVLPPATGTWLPPNPVQTPTYPPLSFPTYPTLAQQMVTPFSLPTLVTGPSTLVGADIQMTDVISFDVRVFVVDALTKLPVASNPNDPFVTLFHPAFTLTPAEGLALPVPITSYNNKNPAFFSQDNVLTNPLAPAVFDTWTSIDDGILSNYPLNWRNPGGLSSIPMWNSTPNPLTPFGNGPIIKAIQITIRIWDSKTNQARQVTIVQAM